MIDVLNKKLSAGSPLIMGILNVTPDSFSDGGEYIDTNRAVVHALEMVENGADIIDIGGESSRPNALPVSEEIELRRVVPVVQLLSEKTSAPISIDTYKAEVARQAVQAGASIINDISAMRFDERMADVVRESNAVVVLMHMQGDPGTMQKNPEYDDVVNEIIDFLDERANYAVDRGINRDNIILDPGIGFGKTFAHNIEILQNIEKFSVLGYPVLVGASRKGFIGTITGNEPSDRVMGTAAVVSQCVFQGVSIHRVHDVKEMRQVCDVAAVIRG